MSASWRERREGGGRFAIWLIRAIGLYAGRGVARLVLYPVVLYFFLRRTRERRDSRHFLSLALGRPARVRDVLAHIHCYAATILDRIFLLRESDLCRFDIRLHGVEQLEARMAQRRGVLLLGAHLGSFEALRALTAARPEIELRVVMELRQTRALNELLHALNPAAAAKVIAAGKDPGALALALREAAQRGALIGLLADRARENEATAPVAFFGRTAHLPVSPYLLASVLELPIVLAFGLYRGGNRYDIHFEDFSPGLKIPRGERAAQTQVLAQRYAARLEHYTRLAPFNWFNFYDFWHCPDGEPAARREPVAAV